MATRSSHKLREIRQIAPIALIDLEQAGVPCDPAEEGLEIHETFAGNALAKARYFCGRSGLVTLADDSGLCVDALGGDPGVRSRRYAGRAGLEGEALDAANTALLLERLRDVPADGRAAHYQCAVAIVHPDGREELFEGRCDGIILDAPRGTGGFGYDPVFFLPQLNATFAQVDPATKNRLSHRAKAIRAAIPTLSRLDPPPDSTDSRV